MAAQPNLGGRARLGYACLGLALIAWGFLGADSDWARHLLPTAGGVLLVESLIGY